MGNRAAALDKTQQVVWLCGLLDYCLLRIGTGAGLYDEGTSASCIWVSTHWRHSDRAGEVFVEGCQLHSECTVLFNSRAQLVSCCAIGASGCHVLLAFGSNWTVIMVMGLQES